MIRFLKEWDVIGRALEDGRQILLARKGGILDPDGLFQPAYDEFFLYSTRLHQTEQARKALKASEWLPYERFLEGDAMRPESKVEIRLFCRVSDVFPIRDVSSLRRIEREHVWTPSYLEKRFEGGTRRGLMILVIRAYKVRPPQVLPLRPEYAGCKSWVEDPSVEIRPQLSFPVLSEEEFLERRLRLRRALS